MGSLAQYADKALLEYAKFLNSSRDDGSQFRSAFTTGGGIPSSILIIFPREAFTDTPILATQRLILLALIADRAQLIPRLIQNFGLPDEPLLTTQLLEPYVNNDISQYADNYLSSSEKWTTVTGKDKVFSGIGAMGRLRIRQNLIIRDALRARYTLIEVIADPFTYVPDSLRETGSLITKCEISLQTEPGIYSPLKKLIDTLRRNYDIVRNHLTFGESVSQDILRKLRVLLGVFNESPSSNIVLQDQFKSTTAAIPSYNQGNFLYGK